MSSKPASAELSLHREYGGVLRLPAQTGGILLRFMRKRPLAGTGLAIAVLLSFSAVFAGVVAPYDYKASVGGRLEAPSTRHWFGTDRLGRDQFSRVIVGGRVSMFIGVSAVLLGTAIAAAIGLLSGSLGGAVDLVVQRFVDMFMAFPALVLLLTVVSAFGSSQRNVILLLGILFGVVSSRVVRSAVIAVRHAEYVSAAKAVGCSHTWIVLRHILPNVLPTLIVLMSVSVGAAILAEASLSFLGFGVQPPTPSWGGLLSTDLQYMVISPWLAFWPGLALTLAVFAFNVLGDGLRDSLDPRLRGV